MQVCTCPACGDTFAAGKSKTATERAAKHAMFSECGPDDYQSAKSWVETTEPGGSDGSDGGGSDPDPDPDPDPDNPLLRAPEVDDTGDGDGTGDTDGCPECGGDMETAAGGHRFSAVFDGEPVHGRTEGGEEWCEACGVIVDHDGDVLRGVSAR